MKYKENSNISDFTIIIFKFLIYDIVLFCIPLLGFIIKKNNLVSLKNV
ncbi:hypothetical protein AAJ76_1390006705 [Vairimorpha ceranae]|uniref:Uncharacterized protein n=1 Tax=Vairimorpha ceranae TaxID=40302 RepID=A0A0F9W8H2_9MICR|nr:hypothetical protein AAJ76_1390006705 [Vairimorpha ceranae]KKO74016.1 hypothetical protein AAJ76_1390006705 [Vairimorpha ceranae]